MQVERQLLQVKQRQVMIELPESFVNRQVEFIVLTVDDQAPAPAKNRTPHPAIAGKGRTLGDLIAPMVDEADWACLQ